MTQEKYGRIQGVGLVLSTDSTMGGFNNVMPEPKETPLSQIVGQLTSREQPQKKTPKIKKSVS